MLPSHCSTTAATQPSASPVPPCGASNHAIMRRAAVGAPYLAARASARSAIANAVGHAGIEVVYGTFRHKDIDGPRNVGI